MTVFFIQFQKEQPDFSDAVADPTLYHSLDEALKAFELASGHRQLFACLNPKGAVPKGQQVYGNTALVLKRV